MKQHPDLVNVPITGVGGIETWRDALEFILVGASNLQVTTAVMQYGYRIVEDMISGLSHYMEDNGIEKLSDLVGLALPNIVPAEDLDRSFKLLPKFDEDPCAGCGRCYVSCFDGGHQELKLCCHNYNHYRNCRKELSCYYFHNPLYNQK
jgi:dihydropyrimidine dehydrogenase (NAD+) subunit PreA